MAKYIGKVFGTKNGKREEIAHTAVVELGADQVEPFKDTLAAELVRDNGPEALIALLAGAVTIEIVPTVVVADGCAGCSACNG